MTRPARGPCGDLMREPILTDRLFLRDVTEADAELLFDLDSDPEVMRDIGPRPADHVGAYRDRIRTTYLPWQSHPWHGVRVVFDRTTGEFLGWVFVRPATASKLAADLGWTDPAEIEVGYRYRRAAWGRGIATEAAVPLVRLAVTDPETAAVVACAEAGNAGSLRVLEKLGLARVGEVGSDARGALVKLTRRGTTIRPATPDDRDTLTELWLRSVRATHTFLTEDDVQRLLPLVRNEALAALEVWVLEEAGRPVGFSGLAGNKLEGLFLDPDHIGRGGGRRLVEHARRLKGPLTVDVNEQNPAAVQFYRALGFREVGRSPVDSGGRPFPLIHMTEQLTLTTTPPDCY